MRYLSRPIRALRADDRSFTKEFIFQRRSRRWKIRGLPVHREVSMNTAKSNTLIPLHSILKSMFMPRGWRVWHLKIIRPSALRRWVVSLNPVLNTDTITITIVCPGEEKCFATGRSAFFLTDLRCSQNLSPSLRPVSPM